MKGLQGATRGLVVPGEGGARLLHSPLGCERVMARPWAKELSSRAQAARGLRWLDSVAAWFDEVVAPRVAHGVQADRSASFRAMCHLPLMDLREEALAYAAFVRAGSQVFTLSDEYVFRVGYVEGDSPFSVPGELPYPAFFLAFRGRASMAISDDIRPEEECDGCFVRRGARGELHLFVTYARLGESSTGWPGAALTLPPSHEPALGLRQFVEDDLRRRGLDVRKLREPARRGLNGLTVAQVDRMAGLLSYQREVRVWAVASATRLVLRALESLQDVRPQARTAEQSNESRQPPALPAPPLQAPTAPAHRTVNLHLSEPVVVIAGVSHQRAAVSIAEHWRRAHWRRQPCGPGRRDRQLIRVREARVGTGATRESSHIYVVLP